MFCPCKETFSLSDDIELSEAIVELHPHKSLLADWVKEKKWVVRRGWGFFQSILKQED